MRRWQLLGITCAAVALLASACTGNTGTTAAVGSANPASCKGVTLRFIGLAGEDGKAVTKAFQAKYRMKISETNVTDWPTAISAIKVGQPYDLMTVPMWYAQRMIAAGIVRPLDTSKLTEWKNLFPGLAKNSLILGKSGTVYGAPIAWGDGPFVYNPKLVSNPPTSLLELLKPQWQHKYVLFNSNAIMDTLALEDGYKNAPLLTKAQFDVVTNQATTLVKNAQAFTSTYQDGTDRLVSGDAAIDVTGWEAMVNFAKAKGVDAEVRLLQEPTLADGSTTSESRPRRRTRLARSPTSTTSSSPRTRRHSRRHSSPEPRTATPCPWWVRATGSTTTRISRAS